MLGRLRALAFVVLASAVAPLQADEQYDRLLESFQEAREKWIAQTATLKKGKKPPPDPTRNFVPKFREYARQHAGKPEALPALVWLIEAAKVDPQHHEADPPATWAIQALRRDHAASPALADVMEDLRNAVDVVRCDHLVPFYELVRKKNPDPQVKAAATFNLAYALWVGGPGGTEDARQRAADKQKATSLFQTLTKDYPDSPLADEAEDFLAQAEHVDVGVRAPEIIGNDVNGKEIRLSHFRGRVVVLLFWGFW
jgi:hypothetical protein